MLFSCETEIADLSQVPIPTKLLDQVTYALKHVPAYRDYPPINHLRTLEDFQTLPVVMPKQLAARPRSFVAKGSVIYRISSSGGTSGKKKATFRTYEDHVFGARVAAEMFKTASLSSSDVMALLHPFDVWGISFVGLEALRFIGAQGLTIGASLDDAAVADLLLSFQPTVLYTTPSRASTILEVLVEKKGKASDWCPRAILLAGEPITTGIRGSFLKYPDLELYSIYGSEETDGLGAECSQHHGIHIVKEGLVYELLDPKTMAPTRSDTGLLVVTPLESTGTVLLRYCLQDLVTLDLEPCPCGRSTPRITGIKRSEEGIVLWDGVYIGVSQLESAISALELHGLGASYLTSSSQYSRASLILTLVS